MVLRRLTLHFRSQNWFAVLLDFLIVVVGLFIGLQFDTWWHERISRVAAQDVLEKLHADFVRNGQEVERVSEYHLSRFRQVDELAGMNDADVLAIPSDSTTWPYVALMGPVTYEPTMGTVDSLIETGDLDLIRDQRLREMLLQYIHKFDGSERVAERLLRSAELVWEATIPHGGPWKDFGNSNPLDVVSSSELVTLMRDPGVRGLVRLNHNFASQYVSELNSLESLCDEIVSQIEENL